AQRRPGSVFAAGVDRRRGLRADREFRGVGIVEQNLDPILALRDVRAYGMELRDLVALQILGEAVGLPDGVDATSEDLPGIEVESDFDRLAGAHVFEVFLEV